MNNTLLFIQIILYCMAYSYITVINMHTQVHWSCIELITDVHLNHHVKVPNTLWTIMCTHSIKYNCFNLSKVFIKMYNTNISIVTVLFVLFLDSLCIIANSSHIDQTCIGGFFLFTIVPFFSTESLTEYSIAPVVWITFTLYCQCCIVAPFIVQNFHHVIFVMHLELY